MNRIQSERFLTYGKARGIDTDTIAETYGRGFTVWLIKTLTRPKPKNGERKKNAKRTGTQYFPYPKKVLWKILKTPDVYEQEEITCEFLDILKDAGFHMRRWSEDSVDDETGRVVSVMRTEIQYID